ncbi:MAG: hypothetical protein ACYC27_23235 [Armatimonadota bacterium]
MNRSSNNDEANTTQYTGNKYVYQMFAILTGIGLAAVFIPALIKNGIRSELFNTLLILAGFLHNTSKWLDETGRKKLGRAVGLTSGIPFLGAIITRYVFEGKIF